MTLIEELITVPFRATVTYKWNVTAGAAQILGADNHYSVVLTVPPNTQNISVSVSVWIDGCNFTDTFTFTPLDPAIAMRIERFCRLRRYIHVNMFINALWDPLRDLVTRPLTNNEIQGMTNIVEGISQLLEDTQH